jgi:RNA-binding protein
MSESPGQPALDKALRKMLLAAGNRLPAKVVIGHSGLTDAVVSQVRHVFEKVELLKIRVEVEKGAEADAIGEELASRLSCHLVRRVGKVLLIYRPLPSDSER